MSFEVEAKNIAKTIEDALSRIGIFHRIFFRGKSLESIKDKINRSPGKYGKGKKIQDIIGIRICLYFSDDIDISKQIIDSLYIQNIPSSTIDKPDQDQFGPTRYNLIYNTPDEIDFKIHNTEINHSIIDNTFEVQIRTILSEGWHEVEHDLRYKFSEDWSNNHSANRTFNGVFAALETSEITMLKIIEDQSYYHYKNKNWPAMIRSKFRLRFSNSEISEHIIKVMTEDNNFAKDIFRFDRNMLIELLFKITGIPVTADNIIYIINHKEIRNEYILTTTPKFLDVRLCG